MPGRSDVLWTAIEGWLDDPESDVEYAEEVATDTGPMIAVRMRQEVRDASTVWWTPGERTLTAEVGMIPAPRLNHDEVFRLALVRNRSLFRVAYALSADGGVVVRSRLPNEAVTIGLLDAVLGELYEQVEVSFRPFLRLAFGG